MAPSPITSQNLGHYDAPLTGFAVAFTQEQQRFISQRLFPVLPVDLASGVYAYWPKGQFYRDEVNTRPMGGYSRLIGAGMTWKPYGPIEEETLSVAIDRRELANQVQPVDLERAKTRVLMTQHMIHAERKLAAAAFATGIWGTDIAGHATNNSATETPFWNLTTSDPITDLIKRNKAMLQKSGYKGNVLAVGSDVDVALKTSPAVLDRINGGATTGSPAFATNEMLARFFEVDEYIVAEGVWNSAVEKQTEPTSYSFIIPPKAALLLHRTATPSMEEPSGGYTLAWRGLLGQAANGVTVYRIEDERARSTFIDAATAHDQQVVAPELGVYFNAVVQ